MTNRKHRKPGALALILVWLLCNPRFATALEVAHLTCERAENPQGITTRPRLAWILKNPSPDDRGQCQTAYQIVVASMANSLADGRGNLWDSGKIASDDSIDVPYAGEALHSGQPCFWKVRVWDRDGVISPWSAPAAWTMGLLDPNEWTARWIGVGAPADQWRDYTVEATFLLRKVAVAVYFRAQGASNSYMWQISNTGPTPAFRPHVRVDGSFQLIKNMPIDRWLKPGDFTLPHRLTIQARGDQITTSLDGQIIDVMTDQQHATGGIGFRASPTEESVFQKVRVTDSAGAILLNEDFTRGISTDFPGGKSDRDGLTVADGDVMYDGSLRTPRLRREFAVDKPIARAWIYASALGIYELRLNGAPVGDQYFAPGWTNYRKRIEYQMYDVTPLMRVGKNAIAAQLAPGWYAGNIGWFGPNQYGSVPRLFTELHIEFTDGTTAVVNSDSNWKASIGPIVSSDFQDGEIYDARREQPGWDQSGFDDHAWRSVETGDSEETAHLVSQIDPPMRVTREWKPVEVTEPRPGVFIYRLPQNITGVSRLRLKGSRGSIVTVRHGEAINSDGTLNLITLNSPGIGNARAHNIDTFVFGRESEATFQPHFTWRGFQFIEISGVTSKPSLEDVTGLSIGTDVPDIGEIQTSSDLINRINQNTHWSGRDAFMSFPMDCPQRSERLGWAGDANFYLATAAFNFDMSRFYSKWEWDLIDSQSTEGRLCHVAPGGWAGSSSEGGYGGGWGDVAVCVPYQIWKNYGDLQIIRDHYQPMSKWIAFLQQQSPDLILPGSMAEAGDWQEQRDSTPHELCATAYFAYDVRLLTEMADAIGKKDDAERYRKLFGEIHEAFAKKFIAADGKISTGSQTAYVLSLHIGLVPDDLRDAAAQKLVESIVRHGNQLTTGFVGTQWLLPVLTDIGRSDLAYAVLEQTKKPSWGYMVNHGATTIWESWNVINANGTVNGGANSLNHCALGSCGDWIYENIGGIQRDPQSAGFKSIIIHPRPGGGVTSAEAHYHSPYGAITTEWHVDRGLFTLNVTVPAGTRARIFVPSESPSQVTESGAPASESKGVRFVMIEDHAAVFAVGSGVYAFTAKTP